MSTFKVGQRVRIVRSFPPYKMVGAETTIVRWRDDGVDEHGDQYSGWELNLKNCMSYPVIAWEWQLEPILPDGHRAAEESLEELLPFLKEQKVTA